MQSHDSPRLLVVDASVAVKWFLQDEDLTSQSLKVLDDLDADRVAPIASSHFGAEVSNAIRNALRPGRLTSESARTSLTTLLALSIETVPSSDLIAAAFEAALRFDCAMYDALYLALAEQIGCPFVHADRRLHNTLAGRFPHELWIENYATN